MDKTHGFRKLTAMISLDDHFVRLNTRAFRELISIFERKNKTFEEAIQKIYDHNDKMREKQQENSDDK